MADLWGETWTAEDINDADFGVGFSVHRTALNNPAVDHIRITIYYTTAPTGIITNTTKAGIGTTWEEDTNDWSADTNTWASKASKVSNTSKPRSLGSYTFDEKGNKIISETGGSMSDSSFMINESKP